ncbi:glycoside hydrolase family 3 N-terminal domain-containing protein [Stakelama saccharophila]|uniref:Glycoside hydrolase family 3 N-terminal domain-containing protein n=1 Tax=Stakelama saccharophila TaxID=3075605 RepID=A0ABZ0B6X4_9SPHN|nr:glycoside hydrolase family 3 N-terminal domain-containing protein [Stakelama sp. W311]WNO53151.1 glycoside hydrolase family 3 N-terminal domain-containing protein [Stakelama sp. W311]
MTVSRRRFAGSLGLLASFTVLPPIARAQAEQARRRDKVESIIAGMSLEEKALQLCVIGDDHPKFEEYVRAGLGGTNGIITVGAIPGIHLESFTRKTQQLATQSPSKVPIWYCGDTAHGFTTEYPVPLALAATWNPELVRQVHRSAATEATAHGVTWTFSPMLDIARDPRWGRMTEGAGEDPYLGSVMAVAQVRGFQGDDLSAPDTMLATAKHFAGYGGVQAGRDYNSVNIPEREFRDIYLPPFKAACDAGIGSVMAAFNTLDGVPVTSSRELLTGVLRERWGWDGVIVSDYDAVLELVTHGVAADPADAAAQALRAGVDVDLHSGTYAAELPGLVRSGRLKEAEVDSAVRRVLTAKAKLGLLDDPFRYGNARLSNQQPWKAAHREQAREAARQAMVLLKNDGVLPLARSGAIAVIGPLADDQRNMLGTMPALGRSENVVTMLDGLRRVAGERVTVRHAMGVPVKGDEGADIAGAVALAEQCDVTVLVLGESDDMIGEGDSRASIDLPGRQLELARAVIATGKPVVAVFSSGRALDLSWLDENANAIVDIWVPGEQGGTALADLLFGDANFSGKLPVTFPRALGQVPISYDHLPTGRPGAIDEVYTSRYVDLVNAPLYPFGHGLSYTSFDYGAPRLSGETLSPGGTLRVTTRVENTGRRAGATVAQLYVHDRLASVSRPVRRLKGFERVELAPGEAREVTFTLTPDDLAFMRRDRTWGTEPGDYDIYIGDSSNAEATARFRLSGPS